MTHGDESVSGPGVVYGCTQTDCAERFRGFTDEPGLWCSVCLHDLTAIENLDGRTLGEMNAMATVHRPLSEVERS